MHKKYIKRGDKKFGPYYYTTYREGDKIKTKYIRKAKNSMGPGKIALFLAVLIVCTSMFSILLTHGTNENKFGTNVLITGLTTSSAPSPLITDEPTAEVSPNYEELQNSPSTPGNDYPTNDASILVETSQLSIMDEPLGIQSIISITNCSELQAMQNNLSGEYILTNDIDCDIVPYNAGAGFEPIGNWTTPFRGTFDGQNHTITRLFINRPSTDYIGLFGYVSFSEIENVKLEDVNITGNGSVGGLVGSNDNGIINNSYSTGNLTGGDEIGGLVGYNTEGTISNSYSTVNVTGLANIGGLVGESEGTINNSYSTGNVKGDEAVGGLIGYNFDGIISNSYSTGNVNGTTVAGGLVGSLEGGSISNSYSTGNVDGTTNIGRLIGYSPNSPIMSNSYWNNKTGNPNNCWTNSTGSYNIDCNAIQDNEPYFYNISNAPMNIWSFPPWDNFCDAKGHPTLEWENITAIGECRGYTPMAITEMNISVCQVLDQENIIYYLNHSVNSSGTCFNILANNVTLECGGFTIKHSGSGIYVNGYNHTTIKNCTITGDQSKTYGIRLESSSNNTVTGNTVIMNGSFSTYGIRLESSSNNIFTNNILSTWGIDFSSGISTNNNIINMTFNSSSYPTTASLFYDGGSEFYEGGIEINSMNAIESPGLYNVSKYLQITTYPDEEVLLNISYTDETIGLNESNLKMYLSTGPDSWVLANTTSSINGVDTINKVVYANITSSFGFNSYIFAPLSPDTTPPVVSLMTADGSKTAVSAMTLKYNVTDISNITNCSILLNNKINKTGLSITKDVIRAFTVGNLSLGNYNWNIVCADQYNNTGASGNRMFEVYKTSKFSGSTTNLSQVDISNITNLTIENPTYGGIKFLENMDLSNGSDLDANVNISSNWIEIKSNLAPELNGPAKLILYNLIFTNPQIMADNDVCPLSLCGSISYNSTNKTLTFRVAHFTAYYARETPIPPPGGGGGGGGGGSIPTADCNESWKCSNWSACKNEAQTRTCSDLHNCGTMESKPAVSQKCAEKTTVQNATNVTGKETPASVITPKSTYWIYYLFGLSVAILALISVIIRRKLLEGSLKNKIKEMEHSLEINDLENARKIYAQIKKIYSKVPVKSEKVYHDKIIGLYQRALGFK